MEIVASTENENPYFIVDPVGWRDHVTGEMVIRVRHRSLFLVGAILLAEVSCISLVSLDEAPCPCGNGYECCPTLGICLQPGATCPESYPASSRSSCNRDAECRRGEACHSWSADSSNDIVGPRECRRKCEPSIACATGETCQVAPHNGLPLNDFETIPLCQNHSTPSSDSGMDKSTDLDGNLPEECQQWSCEGCPVDRLGRTFCDGSALFGCLVSTSPTCGLMCEKIHVKQCSVCTETEGVVTCSPTGIFPEEPCKKYPCSVCPAGATTFCQGTSITACLKVSIDGEEECNELCLPQPVFECSQTCVQESAEARCFQ